MIIRALPGSGKTTLVRATANKKGRQYADTDDLLRWRFGDVSPLLIERLTKSKRIRMQIRNAISSSIARNAVLLTNLDVTVMFQLPISYVVAYTPADYISHLKLTSRDDLLDRYTENELKSWAVDYQKYGRNMILLEPGEFLPTALCDYRFFQS